MLVIRLSRTGAKKRPFYHLVAVDSRAARDSGKYIERLGYFNPVARGAEIRLHFDQERVADWISKGAQPSDRVAALIKEAKSNESGIPFVEKKQQKRDAKKSNKAKALEAAQKAEAEEKAKAEAAEKAELEAKQKAEADEKAKAEAAQKAETESETKTEADEAKSDTESA
jgi:small subunit ribosomal protein S16